MQAGRAFWDRIDRELRAELSRVLLPLKFAQGEIVFSEGDPFRGFFIVERGLFKVYRLNEKGREAILNFFEDGELFALAPLFSGRGSYPASCCAVEPGRLSLVNGRAAADLLARRPDFAKHLNENFAQAAEELQEKTALVMLNSVEERVIHFLDKVGARERPIALKIPKNQIALYLGATPEAFSRALLSLKQQGKLHEEAGYVQLAKSP
jgi:CRP/FNR family transcriptional regulator